LPTPTSPFPRLHFSCITISRNTGFRLRRFGLQFPVTCFRLLSRVTSYESPVTAFE